MSFDNVEAVYPLTSAQASMLSEERCGRLVCDLRGDLDFARFESAWRQTSALHPMLRVRFARRRVEAPLQVIHRTTTLSITRIDLSHFSEEEQQARIEAFHRHELSRGIDLNAAAPLRLSLIRRAPELSHLVICYALAALDGRSVWTALKRALAIDVQLREKQELNPQPVRGFKEYIAWLEGQDVEETERHWQRSLEGVETRAWFHFEDRKDSATECAELQALAPVETLIEFTNRQRICLETLALGAWALLTAKYHGAPEIVVGVEAMGRPAEWKDRERLVGRFSYLLPFRVSCKRTTKASDWLRELESQRIEAETHQHCSNDRARVLSGLGPEDPFWCSVFVWDEIQTPADSPLLELRPENIEHKEASDTPIQLCCGLVGDSLRIVFKFDRRKMNEAAATRLLGHFQALLLEITIGADRWLEELGYLTAAERRSLTASWKDLTMTPLPDVSIGKAFAAQASRTPDSIALDCQDGVFSYAEINQRANRLGRRLRRLGVGPEVVVGVCLPRSSEAILALLAILKAGGAFLPMDPLAPLERLAYMLEDSQAAFWVTDENLLDQAPTVWAHPVLIHEECELSDAFPIDDYDDAVMADSLAYVIYTSGSTGKPKGVQATHRGVINLAAAQREAFRIGPGSRVLQFASLSFDAAVSEIFVTLLNGGVLVVSSEENLGANVLGILQETAVTTATLPPALLSALDGEPPSNLLTLISAGDICPASLIGKWARGRRLINAYGPTEATVCATLTECIENDLKPPIGRPIDNAWVYILDDLMGPVAAGVTGELYIAGAGVTRGYRGRPDFTAESFVPNLFGVSGERLYRTGDLGRWLESGEIEYLGRTDAQVKLRGYRIELGEIETIAREYPGVRECAAMVREEANGDKRLVAYLTANGATSTRELRDFLRRKLPEYMTPSQFVVLENLPLNRSGKIDRARLPQPEPEAVSATFQAPRNPTESQIAVVWAELLRLERPDIHANFFDQGGHSLLAAQLISRLREACSVELPVNAVFTAPTIAGLAAEVEQARETQSKAAIRPLARRGESRTQLLDRLNRMSASEVEAILHTRTLAKGNREHD